MSQLLLLNVDTPTIVSDEDVMFLLSFKFHLSERGYLQCHSGRKCKYNNKYLHKMVAERMGLNIANKIDHKDLNQLNNQRNNLREATQAQNGANAKLSIANTSGHTGIYEDKRRGGWIATITYEGVRWQKHFDTKQEAISAWIIQAKQLKGEFIPLHRIIS